MQIQSKHILTMLVVAGISVAAFPAKAATITAGDVLLGFRATSGTGSTSNLIVNLGQADTIFRNATSNISSVANIGSLLTSTFGAGWDTRSDLFWGAVANANSASGDPAIDGDPGATNYYTKAQTSLNPGIKTSTAANINSSTSRVAISNNIQGLNTTFAAATGTNSVVIPSSGGTTWSSSITASNFGVGSAIEASNANGIDATGLDLYRILDSNTDASPSQTVGVPNWEGTFTISNTGVVGFSVNAVPEPSRAVLAALGLGGLLLRRRRRSQKA
ncbi:MAG: PEP-CTERM sorting domain-containing protein [Verrucomicrobia bacterium]|nr:PEP-CTERM sorting domain-containing protein [Verrucomicrobiota bacterium]